jgi:hypothetical protein
MRNRDSQGLVSLNALLRMQELVNSHCRCGFCMNKCIYSKLEMSRILNCDPEIRNFQILVAQKTPPTNVREAGRSLRLSQFAMAEAPRTLR